MYFDAVRDILSKLKNENLSFNDKYELQLQLRVLDPKDLIRQFILGLIPRPDISDTIKFKYVFCFY